MNKKWIVVAAGVAVAAALGAGVVMAQDGGSGASGPSFLSRVAQKLGIDEPRLQQAIKDARTDQIDEAVQNGDLTQEQADRLKQRLEQAPGDAPFGLPFKGHGGFGLDLKGRGLHLGGAGLDKTAFAGFLGIDETQLRDALSADGATLASVAEANGKSRDELKTFILSQLDERLAEAVANGLPQERADAMRSKVEQNLDTIIDTPCGGKGRGFGFRGHQDETPAAPQEQSGSGRGLSRS